MIIEPQIEISACRILPSGWAIRSSSTAPNARLLFDSARSIVHIDVWDDGVPITLGSFCHFDLQRLNGLTLRLGALTQGSTLGPLGKQEEIIATSLIQASLPSPFLITARKMSVRSSIRCAYCVA
jgi:hypothetical protein